mmetsp:Transcript_14244/g.21636  ORF Transcript_14244/g.21636 Transcript_14244/m.21636 type:complete len:630 (+) Transcript_14244:112-2001(+)
MTSLKSFSNLLIASALLSFAPATRADTIVFASFHAKGHVNGIKWAAKELLERGEHDIVFAVPERGLKQVTRAKMCADIPKDVPCRYRVLNTGFPGFTVEEEMDIFSRIGPAVNSITQLKALTEYTIKNEIYMAKAMIEDFKENKPDLVVLDSVSIGASDAAEVMGIPFILIATFGTGTEFELSSQHYQDFEQFSYLPFNSLHYSQSKTSALSTPSRLVRAVLRPFFFQVDRYYMMGLRNKVRADLGLPPISSIIPTDNHPLTLIAEAPGIAPARPLPPNVVLVGPQINTAILKKVDGVKKNKVANSKPTPKEVRWMKASMKGISSDSKSKLEEIRWIESSEKDVVFVSFGTIADLTASQLRALYLALASQTRFRVLWSLRERQEKLLEEGDATTEGVLLSSFPDHVKPLRWVSQQDVLAHPKVKIFLSHCGMNSLNEAIIFSKPVLAFPRHGDQATNAQNTVDLGIGIMGVPAQTNEVEKQGDPRDISEMTPEHLASKLNRLVDDPSYLKNMKKIGGISKFAGGATKVADWVEHFLELDGDISHLVPASFTAPIWLRYDLDIYVFFAVIIILVAAFINQSVRRLSIFKSEGEEILVKSKKINDEAKVCPSKSKSNTSEITKVSHQAVIG